MTGAIKVSEKRRRKQERRRSRNEKRELQRASRPDKRLQCQNCGDMYRPDPQPEAFHRAGPCDCDANTLRRGNSFLDKRAEEYENAKNGRIACKTCGTMHDEDKQQTIFIEGRLIWDGCDRCVEERFPELLAIYEAHRDRWFGPNRPRLPKEQTAHDKYVAPFEQRSDETATGPAKEPPGLVRRESIRDSYAKYGGMEL